LVSTIDSLGVLGVLGGSMFIFVNPVNPVYFLGVWCLGGSIALVDPVYFFCATGEGSNPAHPPPSALTTSATAARCARNASMRFSSACRRLRSESRTSSWDSSPFA